MSELTLYKSEWFQGVECDFWKNENDEILMTAEQLGNILEYSNPRKAVNKIVLRNPYLLDNEFSGGVKMVSPSGMQETRVFTEDGIYEITMLAKTEKAKEFRTWVRQILKGLRKGELELLQKQIEESKPKLQLYEQVINAENCMSMLQVAKALKISGRNKLFKFLRSESILMDNKERHNIPYQQFCDAGYFLVVLKPMLIERKIVDIPVTLVTPKGMNYIYRRLEKRKALQNSKAI
jgi:phage antirepressor YoqD-like protein